MPCSGSPIAQFIAKLKHTKQFLRDLNKAHGNIHSVVQTSRDKLLEIQETIASTGDTSLLSTEKDLITELNIALLNEESLLLPKAKVKWMGLGDANNSFFYQHCKVNWNRNKILALEDVNGSLCFGQTSCAKVVVDYYHNLLGPSISPNTVDISMVDCKVINEDQARLLEALVTDIIIFDTLKKIKKKRPLDLMV